MDLTKDMEDGGNEVNKKGMEYSRKSTPPPFLLKTFMLVEDKTTDEIISWNDTGTAFIVWKTAEFARDVLPTLFKHSNFSSFVRQLNTYGFRKAATSRWEFCNDMFKKGERELLSKIRRRKAWSNKQNSGAGNQHQVQQDQMEEDQRSSSTTSSEYSILVDENKRLKKENGVLSSELKTMKRKCKELLDIVTQYAHMEEQGGGPKLFGVVLEVEGNLERKRKRAEISESASILLSQSFQIS